MKRLLMLLMAAVLCLSLTACAEPMEEQPAQEVTEDEDVTCEAVCVGVEVGEQGYYSLLADVELHYYDGEVSAVYVIDPTLLAFSVSERWAGGVCLMSGEDMAELMTLLHEMLQTYRSEALQEDILKAIEMLENSPAITGAST